MGNFSTSSSKTLLKFSLHPHARAHRERHGREIILTSHFLCSTAMEITNEGGDDIVHLYNASASGCTTTLKSLIDKDPRILYKISSTPFSETPLRISALLGHLDFTRTLLAQNPRLAVELDSYKRCSLHLASAEGHIEIVKALLHANEDTCSIHDEDGKIPLHYAAMRGRIEVVKALIAVRPDSTRVMVNWKETILHLCVKYNQLEALKLLVDSVSDEGEFLNFKDHEGGNTILHLAVMLRQIETVKYLLSVSKVREEVDSLNYMGFTALQMLENCPKDFKSFTIRNILMDVSARVERVNNLSPLSTVAVGHHESVDPTQLRKNWLKYLKYQGDWVEDNRGAIMVVATVITTITFQNTANPPGGVWQTTTTERMPGFMCYPGRPCEAGRAVLAHSDDDDTTLRYLYFTISNAISFVASLCVTFLLISGFPIKNRVCMSLLTLALCTTLISLAVSYLVAYHMVTPDTLFREEMSASFVQRCVTGSLIAVISMVILTHAIRFLSRFVKQ